MTISASPPRSARVLRVCEKAFKAAAEICRLHIGLWTVQLETMLSCWRSINQRIISAPCTRAALGLFSLRPRPAPAARLQTSRKSSGNRYNVPPSAEFVARVSGIPTMAKLPYQETADGLDAAFVGVPIDTGTSNRPGARWLQSLDLLLLNCVSTESCQAKNKQLF